MSSWPLRVEWPMVKIVFGYALRLATNTGICRCVFCWYSA
jgi:hypothetical protein